MVYNYNVIKNYNDIYNSHFLKHTSFQAISLQFIIKCNIKFTFLENIVKNAII